MTRPSTEENLLKCNTPLTETKPFGNIANPLDNNSLILYDLPSHSEIVKYTNPKKFKIDLTTLKRDAEINLYNLEKNEYQNKPIKIDLGIELYQMEDY